MTLPDHEHVEPLPRCSGRFFRSEGFCGSGQHVHGQVYEHVSALAKGEDAKVLKNLYGPSPEHLWRGSPLRTRRL